MSAAETIQTTEVEVEPALRATTHTGVGRESDRMASAVLAGTRVDPAAERVSGLHAEYGDAVYRYCRRHLRSREDAEDATQVVFMNAYRSLAKGAEPINESAWLFKIAENAVLYRRRRIVARERVEVPVPATVIDTLNPALTAEAYGAGRQIVEALSRMPAEQQRAIVLREWQGLAYREVAEVLGVSETTAAMLVIRARAVLARELERPSVFRRLGLGWLGWLLAPLDRIAIGSVVTKAATGLAGAAAVAVPIGTVVATTPPRHTAAQSPRQVAAHHGRSHRHRAAVHPAATGVSYAPPSATARAAPGKHAVPKPNGVAEAPTGAQDAAPAAAVAPEGAPPPADPIAADPPAPTVQAPAAPAPSSDVRAPDSAPAPAADPAPNVDQAPAGPPPPADQPPPAHTNSGVPGKPHPVHPPQAQNDDTPSANAPGQTGVHLFGVNAP
jgi:RNA polymerase sigma-70 factor, ECF subfamily